MKRPGTYILLLLVAVALLSSMLLAAGGCGNPNNGTKTNEPISSTTPISTTGGGGQTPTATSTVPKPGGMPDIADIKSLPSYRLSIRNKGLEGVGAGIVNYLKYEWVRETKAEHAWTEDTNGAVTELYIIIGDSQWIWFGLAGMGWVEQPPQTTPTSSTTSSDVADQLEQALKDVANSKARFDKKGTETVNNVNCIHYEFEYNLTTELPNFSGGTTKAIEHSTGDMWIADQSGLPAVVIKSKSITEITANNEKTVAETEQNLTDIGAAITINPPDGAFVPSTSTPTTTTTPPATTTPAGGTLTLSDDFQGSWNSAWTWIDPNSDVTHDFTANSGFLRLTVPEDNDLAAEVNYDAPRLLISKNGDFTIETKIEFNPQETYQGAGLLIWQDENTFMRLEFGYGGMGGVAKNVVFCVQEFGVLGVVSALDLPDTLTSIELRMQREGNQFRAWYRQAGGTWQEVGSTERSLSSTVNIGITQINQYTTTEISSDFDYVKVYTP
jgi:regulation of enolase protein 1 (concanavalin A-like superfamily)